MRTRREGAIPSFCLGKYTEHKGQYKKKEGAETMKITVGEILALADDARPNATSEILKLQFLNEVEAEIFDNYIAFKRGTETHIKPIHARA